MRLRSSPLSRVFLCCTLLAWGCWQPARAALEAQMQVLSLPGVKLEQVRVRVDQDAEGRMHLALSAQKASVAALGWRRVGIDMDGALTRGSSQRWQFDGTVKLHNAPGGLLSNSQVVLAMDVDANNLQVDVVQGAGHATVALPLDQPTHAQIDLAKLPLAWLQGLLAQAWSGRVTGGRITGTLAVDVLDEGVRASGELSLAKAGFDSPDGSVAGQGLDVAGRMALVTGSGRSNFNADLTLHGGQLLMGPLYADLPAHAVHLAFAAHAQGGRLDLDGLRFNDPDALQLSGSLAFAADGSVGAIDLQQVRARLPAAYQRYGKTWLATLGLRNLKTSGFVQASLAQGAKGPQAFAFDAHNVEVTDAGGRFAVTGLNGGLDWRRGATRPATTLGWQALRLYKLPLGAVTAHWQSRDGTLQLRQPLPIPLLGGQLTMQNLDWQPAAASGQRLDTALVVTGIDMARLSRAFGWPRFKGTVGGAIPGLRYVDGRFDLDGGLSLSVFDGFVDFTRLSLQHPFGSTPVLAGDLSLRQLDLAAMTGVFDFGEITGRLDGSVKDLRLVNWSPVAFKAKLLTRGDGRISQRAVNNLTSVGGGGIAGGLQGAMLKLFDSFGYSRIGLNCTLQGDVCTMGGLEPVDSGYLIVDGRGLPHLKVIGHQRQVSWTTLVQRLQAATHGTAPVIR
jgi:hypothetical protein